MAVAIGPPRCDFCAVRICENRPRGSSGSLIVVLRRTPFD
jgi:hypothetical protein